MVANTTKRCAEASGMEASRNRGEAQQTHILVIMTTGTNVRASH